MQLLRSGQPFGWERCKSLLTFLPIFALIFSCLYKAAPIAVASTAGDHECLFPAVPLPHQNTSLSSMNITDVDVLWQVARLINYHFPAQKNPSYAHSLLISPSGLGSTEGSCV